MVLTAETTDWSFFLIVCYLFSTGKQGRSAKNGYKAYDAGYICGFLAVFM